MGSKTKKRKSGGSKRRVALVGLMLTGVASVWYTHRTAISRGEWMSAFAGETGTHGTSSDTSGGVHRVVAEGKMVSRPGAEVTVGAEIAGRIVRVLVDEKSVVRKGDLIAEIDVNEQVAAAAEARARIAEVDADIRYFEPKVARAEKMAPSGAVSVIELEQWRRDWLAAMDSGRSEDPTLNAIVVMFHKFGIPVADGESFLRSMFLDRDKARYADYKELEEYMYGSAGVIGLMVTRIVGYSSDTAFPHALKLGYAFQLTNFLRDIREDYEELGRIYIPQDELERFGLSERDIAFRVQDQRFVDFMNFQIARNRRIYREALPGIKLLHWRGRLAVRIAYVLYKAILLEIERANYNVFAARVRTNFGQKLWLAVKAVGGIYE